MGNRRTGGPGGLNRAGTVFFLGCLFLAIASAGAADDWASWFPRTADLPWKDIKPPLTMVFVEEPLPPDLRFAIPVPGLDWQRAGEMPQPEDAQLLACITSPRGPSFGMIEVYTLVPSREVDPLDFLLYFQRLNGVEILATRLSMSSGGQAAETLGILRSAQGSPAEPVVSRTAVYRSGKRFFVVRCQADESRFASLGQTFAAATGFFSPRVFTAPVLIGDWRAYCIDGHFCYTGPDRGWKRPSSAKGQVEDVFAFSSAGENSGTLHVKAIEPALSRTTSPLDRITILTESLAARGVSVVERMPPYTFEHANFQEKFYGQLVRCKDGNGQPFELLAASGLTPRGAVLVWAVTKCKEVDFWAWMANKRAFEVVCDSLKP